MGWGHSGGIVTPARQASIVLGTLCLIPALHNSPEKRGPPWTHWTDRDTGVTCLGSHGELARPGLNSGCWLGSLGSYLCEDPPPGHNQSLSKQCLTPEASAGVRRGNDPILFSLPLFPYRQLGAGTLPRALPQTLLSSSQPMHLCTRPLLL